MQECFNKAGIYEIMTSDLKNHEKPRGQSVSGAKCPWGFSWVLMSHVIISYTPALLKHSCMVLFIFTNFCSHWCCFMKFFRFVYFFHFSLLFLLTLVCFNQNSSALHISLNFPNFLCSYWCILNKLHLLCTFSDIFLTP